MSPLPVIVVGNGVAGFACARRLAVGGAPVVLVGPGLPYDRPPLSKRALATGRVPPLADADGLAALGVRHLDGLAVGLDVPGRTVEVVGARGAGARLEGSAVVWAAGLRPTLPPIPGARLLHSCMTPDGVRRLHRRLSAGRRRVVVVGAGLVGCEAAATLATAHEVTLLADGPPLSRLPHAARRAVDRTLAAAGVTVRRDGRALAVEAHAGGVVVHTAAGRLEADLAVGATGSRPAPCPGLPLGPDGLATDEGLAVLDAPGLWACGDLALHPGDGRLAVPHWDHALATGRHVADALLGRPGPYVREPYWFSDLGGLRLQLVGRAAAVAAWQPSGGLHLGIAADGRPVAALLVDAPALLPAARAALAAA